MMFKRTVFFTFILLFVVVVKINPPQASAAALVLAYYETRIKTQRSESKATVRLGEELPPSSTSEDLLKLEEYLVKSRLACDSAKKLIEAQKNTEALDTLIASFEFISYSLYEVVTTCGFLYTLGAANKALDLIYLAKEHYTPKAYMFEIKYIIAILEAHHSDQTELIAFFSTELEKKELPIAATSEP